MVDEVILGHYGVELCEFKVESQSCCVIWLNVGNIKEDWSYGGKMWRLILGGDGEVEYQPEKDINKHKL
jgi:hypothetical protein